MDASAGLSSTDVKYVDVYTAKGLLETGYRYLDVRTNEEYEHSHFDGAVNIPYMFKTEEGKVKNPEFITQVSELCKKDDQLIVACNSGGRALKTCIDLQNAGYEHVKNMEGGYSAWVDAGFAATGDDKRKVDPAALKTACEFPSTSIHRPFRCLSLCHGVLTRSTNFNFHPMKHGDG